jgi:glycosyltransferase involved in cell wall biosynthesis
VVARIAGKIANIPVVYTVHGFGFKPEVPRVRRWAAWMAEFALAPLTAQMVCVSDHERTLAKHLPLSADRMTVIPNGVEDTFERARPEIGPVRIVMVARLAPPKRPDLLLQALALLRDAHDQEIPTTLIGSGPQMPALQALAQQLGLQEVDFVGDVSDVPRRLAQHSVFVLMSDHEGLPISIIEAMRAGLPIVASNLPGVRQLVSDGQQALLVANEAQALAAALGRLLNSAPLRQQMGEGARQRYLTHFTAERMASLVAVIYTRLVDANPIQ